MEKCNAYSAVAYGCGGKMCGQFNSCDLTDRICTCGGDKAKCDFYDWPTKHKESEEEKGILTTVYYAHHRWKYNSKVETYELDLIKRYFPHALIIDPSVELKVEGRAEEDIMAECLEIISKSDIVIFSSMDGMVGKGVDEEVHAAQNANKLVLYIHHNKLTTDFDFWPTPEYNSDRLYAEVHTKS